MQSLRRTASVQSAAWMFGAGVATATGALLLAGTMPTQEFGRLVLFQSLLTVAVGLSPMGIDSLVVREEVRAGVKTALTVATIALGPAIVVSAVSVFVYDFPALVVAFFTGACMSGAVARIFAASEQAALRFHRSQFITQAPSMMFLMGVVLLWLLRVQSWIPAATVLVGSYALSGVVGSLTFRKVSLSSVAVGSSRKSTAQLFSKSFAFAGIMSSVLLLSQVDRLVVGRVLTLDELATLGVVASIVVAPYKLLGAGIGYVLLPRLRRTASPTERRRLLRDEAILALGLGAVGGAALLAFAKPLVEVLYGGRYVLPPGLLMVMIVAGLLRALYGCASGAVGALGGTRQLGQFNIGGWASLGAGLLGALSLSGLGLPGVVAGASIGWLVRTIFAMLIIRSSLADSESGGSRSFVVSHAERTLPTEGD